MKENKTNASYQSHGDSPVSYYQDNLLLKSKIILQSVSEFQFPDWAEKILLIWEYAQLLSQGLLLYSSLGAQGLFERMILYFFKLANPSSFLEFKESSSFAWSMIILMLGITGLKYLLMGYIVRIAYCNKEGQPTLVVLWKWLFRLQARFICFFLSSFWAQTILKISDEGSEWVQVNKTMIIVMLSVLIAGEYMISFLIEMQFCDLLPRKNFLSGKNNEMQLLTLTQKMTIQVLELALKSSMTTTKLWIYSVVNLVFSILRIQRFTLKLPLYHSKTLYLMRNLISVVIALHLVSFIGLIVRAGDSSEMTIQFVIITWILIGLLGTWISQGMLQKALFKLLLENEKFDDPGLLLHRVLFSKELERLERLPHESTMKYHSTYFFRVMEKLEFTRHAEEHGNSYEKYLEGLLLKYHDQDPLIRIYLSKIWFKQFGMCFKVLRMAGDILTKPWSKEYTSYILLLDSIQRASLKATEKEGLNLTEYIENLKLLNDVKSEMIRQVQMKTIICRDILNNVCDVGEIFNQAQLAWKSRRAVQRKVETWLKQTPEYWTTPLLIFSEYYLVVEYSSIKCQKYQEMYTQRFLKNEKYLLSSKILKENIYQDSNVFLLLGGTNSEIKFCSRSIEEVCGDEKRFYGGLHVTKLFISSMQPFYKDLFRQIIDQRETSLMQKTHRVILLNRKGYILEAEFCLWIHPDILSKNLYLNMILRPISSTADFLVIKKDGDIEGATKSLKQILGLRTLKNHLVSLKVLSEELAAANEELNLMILTQKKQEDESSQFLTGKEVDIVSLTGTKLRYHCRMMSISEDLPFIKIIFFTKLKTQNYMTGEEFISDLSDSNEVPQKRLRNHANIRIKSENDDFGSNMQTERNFLTNCGASQRNLLTSRRMILTEQAESLKPLEVTNNENEADVQDFVRLTTASLKNLEERRNLREIKRSLEKKTSSDLFKMLSFTFYVIAILTLVSQLVLMRISNSTMEDLVINKDLLNYAQTRAYYACKMPFTIETSYLLSIGIDVYSYYAGGVALTPTVLIRALTGYYLELAAASKKIIKLLGNLDNKEIYIKVFEKDVRILGSIYDVNEEEFSNFTSFQAVEQLGIAVRYLSSLPNPIASNTTAAYKFVRRNTLGDFLVKNEQVTEIFKESVNNQRNTLNKFILLCTIFNPLALAAVCLLLNLIIWRQYLQEKKHLKAFVKLDPNYVSSIAESMKDFKQTLLDDRSFEDKQLLKLFWEHSIFLENRIIENHHARHDLQKINLTKTKKRYFLFAIQMGVYIAILVGVLLWNFLSMKSSVNVIYTKQSQLELSNEISETTNVDLMGMVEMFMSNNTFNVSGLSPLEHTTKAVKEIGSLMGKVLTGFEEHDGSYDPIIKKIIFEGKHCSLYPTLYASHCTTVTNKGVLTNLVALLTFFESFMTSQLALYENMHAPSEGDLIIGLYTRAAEMASSTSLVSYIAQTLNGIIDEQLTKSIAETRNRQNQGIIIFAITLVDVSFLIWIQILSKIKETNNDFKKVLQVFPTKLVASSFLLKKFIDKFSKHNFE